MGEERRLAYVALTRGRLRVTVSYCAFRRGSTKVSCFVEDLPAENIVHGWLHSQQDGGAAPGSAAKGTKVATESAALRTLTIQKTSGPAQRPRSVESGPTRQF